MGGGTELALACRYRIAVDEPGTKFALPEVMLGIVPGWGGMLRLPQIVGPAAALDMMLTGKNIDAKRAKKMGLADECVPPRVMENAARMLVLSGKPPRQTQLPLLQKLMNGPLKGFVADGAKKQVAKRARQEHYPAPYAIIDQWQNYGGNTLAVPAGKPTSIDALINSATTRNLIRVFFLQDRLKGFGKDAKAFAPQRVHVVGAGVMGGDIAAWCVLRGMTVTLQDQSVERIAPAVGRAAKFFEKKLRDKKLARFALDRLIADPKGDGVRQADVIIEAIFENLEAKQALFADIEARAKPEAVIASNTSSLKLADIAATFKDPSRLVGIHFFNPVAMMPLVEVVAGERTSPEAAQKAAAFVRKIDKLPLPVKDAPGFLVNAVLGPYMHEAMKLRGRGHRARDHRCGAGRLRHAHGPDRTGRHRRPRRRGARRQATGGRRRAAEEAGGTVRGRQARQEIRPGLLHLGGWQGAEESALRQAQDRLPAMRRLWPIACCGPCWPPRSAWSRTASSPMRNWPTPA